MILIFKLIKSYTLQNVTEPQECLLFIFTGQTFRYKLQINLSLVWFGLIHYSAFSVT